MEEDEENYLAILNDSADHCVTRKVCAGMFCSQVYRLDNLDKS